MNSKYIEDIGMRFFDRSVSLAKAGNQCVCCGKSATEFRDEISKREYQISTLCQACQDEVFAEPLDDWPSHLKKVEKKLVVSGWGW